MTKRIFFAMIRPMKRFGTAFLLGVLLFCSSAFAQNTIRLFPDRTPGQPSEQQRGVSEYRSLLENLQPKDRLSFEDGALFEYISLIGEGQTTRVLKVKALNGSHEGTVMALRVPIKNGEIWLHQPSDNFFMEDFMDGTNDPELLKHTYSAYIDNTLQFSDQFDRAGFAPHLYQSSAGQYIALELIHRQFTLDEYIQGKVKLSPEQEAQVEKALIRFEYQTTGISSIQDIGNPGQVIYNGKRFILVDWYNVRLIEGGIYPWAYLWDGLASYTFSGLAQNPMTDRQKILLEKLKKASRDARLTMLEVGVNPINGKAPFDPKNFWKRHFGRWGRIYREAAQTRKERLCNLVLQDVFSHVKLLDQ